jgi:hypothetical protein
MSKYDEISAAILAANGWEIVCYSPFEIQTKDGSFASGEAAHIVLEYLRPDECNPRRILHDLDIEDIQYMAKLHILVSVLNAHSSDKSMVIPATMHEWCESVGFTTKVQTEDDCTWWSLIDLDKITK